MDELHDPLIQFQDDLGTSSGSRHCNCETVIEFLMELITAGQVWVTHWYCFVD